MQVCPLLKISQISVLLFRDAFFLTTAHHPPPPPVENNIFIALVVGGGRGPNPTGPIRPYEETIHNLQLGEKNVFVPKN